MWTRIGAGVAVLALLIVAGVFLLGGGVSPGPGPDEGPTAFSFDLKRVKAAPVTDRTPTDLQGEADTAADAVKATMDRFYFDAYVDPEAWGAYDAAFALLQDPAATTAESDSNVLTLGATAAEDYEALEGPSGTLNVVVLTNEEDAAVSAIARVVFHADARLSAGGATRITSTGSYFLRPGDEGWSIFGYSVDRNEKEAPSSPSPSPTEAA